ncbi:MAG: iron chelate uptake ABC transporter family permease subunit [Erysipelotrichaceae bacterium]
MDKKKKWFLYGITLTLLLIFLFVGLTSKNFGYVFPKRLEKVIVMALVAYALSASSLIFQTITENHLLTPSIMGLDKLYLFIQTIIVFFFGSGSLVKMSGYNNFFLSLTLMLIFSFFLFGFMFRSKSRNVYYLLLCGVVLSTLFDGLSNFMQIMLDPNEFEVLQGRMFASLNNMHTELIVLAALIIFGCWLYEKKKEKEIEVIALGRETSMSLGVDYKKAIQKHLLVVVLLTSVATLLVGPITFLGLLVVSLARKITPTYKMATLTRVSTLLGTMFLIGGSLIVERVFQFNTPLVVVINFIGGLFFVMMMLKEAKV